MQKIFRRFDSGSRGRFVTALIVTMAVAMLAMGLLGSFTGAAG
jgi:hypothetical protein